MKKKSEISNKQWGTAIFNLKILLTVMRVSQVGKFLDAPQQVFVRFIVWDDNEGGGGGGPGEFFSINGTHVEGV